MRPEGTRSPVIRYIASRMVPFIQLYGLYVLGHGEDGPGGGFQGGVIFASSLVLVGLAHGWRHGWRRARDRASRALAPAGALVYATIGFAALLAGGAFLEYGAFASTEEGRHAAHHFGLIGIEIGVMLTVTGSMITLYFEMARPDEPQDDDGSAEP